MIFRGKTMMGLRIGCCSLAAMYFILGTSIASAEDFRCDKFDLQAELDGDQLIVSLDSDCPEFASIIVSVRRSFFEKENNTEYANDYLSESSTVAQWRKPRLVSVAHARWLELLKQQQAKFSRLGMGYDIARIEDELTASAVLHVNQPDKRLDNRNKNLIGKAMRTEGTRVAESEVRISFPVPAGPEVFGHFPSLNPQALELKQSYLLSKRTPLMRVSQTPESFEEIMTEIKEMKYIPAGYVIEIVDSSDVHGTPWYEVVVWDAERNRRGSGWINSDALISQKLESVRQ